MTRDQEWKCATTEDQAVQSITNLSANEILKDFRTSIGTNTESGFQRRRQKRSLSRKDATDVILTVTHSLQKAESQDLKDHRIHQEDNSEPGRRVLKRTEKIPVHRSRITRLPCTGNFIADFKSDRYLVSGSIRPSSPLLKNDLKKFL